MTTGRSQGWGATATSVAFLVLLGLAPLSDAHAQVNDKWITVVVPAEPPNLEGCESSGSVQGRVVKQNIVETLIEKAAEDGSLKPRLATSWAAVDATTWRVNLRPGVLFHDGSPLNAAAVKRSIDRTLGKTVACSDKTKGYNDVTLEVTPVDDLTVQIKTSRPDPILPMRLAGTSIVGPNTLLDKPSLAPVGTGPYVFEAWQAGQQILLKRNEKYWGAKPQVEGVRYVWRDESSVRAAMVKIGEADIALPIAMQDATDPKMDLSFLNSETTFLRLDTARPPMNDRRVRLAMNYAVDHASLIGTLIPKGAVQATQMVMPSIPGHNFDIDKEKIPYDPAKARQLLAEAKAAGVPVDTEITFVVYPAHYPNAAEIMDAYYTMFKAVGFNMKMTTVEPGQYNELQNRPFREDIPPILFQSSHDNNRGNPVFSVFLKYGCKGNSSGYCDEKFDQEVARVSALGGEERVKGWQEIFRYLYEDAVPYVMMFHMVGFTRVNPRINFQPDVTTNGEIGIQKITFK